MQRPRRRTRERGFTLLEIMAVIVLIGLILGVAVPNLGLNRAAALRSEVRRLGATLELARQRAVMTAQPHRVLIGLDEGWYLVEWLGNVADEAAADEAEPLHANSPVAMSPPNLGQTTYRPIPSKPGDVSSLDEDVAFAGAETAEGWFESGEFQVVFARDGTTDAVDIVLRSGDEPGYVLQVSPLIDLVRILDEPG